MLGALGWIVLLAAAAAALGFLHHRFWTWRLRVPGAEDALVFATTRDGWRIALGRRRPRGPARRPPILLCHGLSTNRFSLDSGMERYSLAAFLSAAGFDCFAIDLRGHGASRPDRPGAPRRFGFDDYVREDVPAALEAVREATGEERVLWVGHSLGALVGLAACEAHPDRIAGVVALAGPVHFDGQADLRRYIRYGFLVNGRANRFLAHMVAPFAGLAHPPAAEIAINGRNVDRRVFRRHLANGIEDVPAGVFAQLREWVEDDVFRSADGAVDYRARLSACRQPALFVSAERDGLAPPPVVRAAFERWGGEKRYWNAGLREGFSADYGHTDLLLGRRAPEEIFPRLRDWLLAHSVAKEAAE
jgi:pimeloyl-ACP methyl ester carboxylesterase